MVLQDLRLKRTNMGASTARPYPTSQKIDPPQSINYWKTNNKATPLVWLEAGGWRLETGSWRLETGLLERWHAGTGNDEKRDKRRNGCTQRFHIMYPAELENIYRVLLYSKPVLFLLGFGVLTT